MKKTLKNRFLSLLVVFSMAFALLMPCGIIWERANAETQNLETVYGFYGNQLTENEKKFYKSLSLMNDNGSFKSNVELDLIAANVLTEKDVKAYASGSTSKLNEFYNARDAFALDHPELFYIDYEKVSINFAKKADGSYSAHLGAGRNLDCIATGFNAELVETAETFFVGDDGFVTLLPTDNTLSVQEKVAYVNDKIVEVVETTEIVDDAKMYVNNAYGAVKYKKALSEGFAKAFKVCMDKLEIPCVVVYGYISSENNFSFETHAWNMVQVEGKWFVVDSFLNDTAANSKEFLLVGAEVFEKIVIVDNVVSENGKKFATPALEKEPYNSFVVDAEIVDIDGKTYVSANVNGKNASELYAANDKQFLVISFGNVVNGSLVWNDSGLFRSFKFDKVSENVEGYSLYVCEDEFDYVKVGLTSLSPNRGYLYDNLQDTDVEGLVVLNNKSETTAEKPVIEIKNKETQTVVSGSVLNANETYSVKLTYKTKLVEVNNFLDVAVSIVSINDPTIATYARIQNVEFDGEKVITFDFLPSKLFKHSSFEYDLYISNLWFDEGDSIYTEPDCISFKMQRGVFSVSRMFDVQRNIKKSVNAPTLVDNQALDIVSADWKTVQDKDYANFEKSLITLVASEPSALEKKSVLEVIDTGLDTYQLYSLQLFIGDSKPTIKPEVSYVNVLLPYPNGTSFGDAKKGVVFELIEYRKTTTGTIDYANPVTRICVPTEQGLLVSVDQFGLCAVTAKKSNDGNKIIYAEVVGFGGSIFKDSSLQVYNPIEVVDDTVTYTVKTIDGYTIEFVNLNGTDVTSKLVDGKITLNKKDLKIINALSFGLVSTARAEAETIANVTNLDAEHFVVEVEDSKDDASSKNWILWIVVIVVIIGCVSFITIVVVTHKTGVAKKLNKTTNKEKSSPVKVEKTKAEEVKEITKVAEEKTIASVEVKKEVKIPRKPVIEKTAPKKVETEVEHKKVEEKSVKKTSSKKVPAKKKITSSKAKK